MDTWSLSGVHAYLLAILLSHETPVGRSLYASQKGFATLSAEMDAADTIRNAVARVAALRHEAGSTPGLQAALTGVKAFQAKRFAGTYADLLASDDYAGAARFFLDDLYSDKDYSLRDAQFARIAGALQRLFPRQVVTTAVALAQLHVLTEELDHEMAVAWSARTAAPMNGPADTAQRYTGCWLSVGRESDRNRQLEMVLGIGADLDRLTRTPGLRMMLRMMRRPATAAGLGALQNFLESGFDTFAQMAGKGERARVFLNTIRERESGWIHRLSMPTTAANEADLRACLARATA